MVEGAGPGARPRAGRRAGGAGGRAPKLAASGAPARRAPAQQEAGSDRHVRDRRLHGTPRGGPDPARGAARAWSTAATTRPGSPWSPRPASCSSRRRRASSPTSRRRSLDRTPHAGIGLAHTRWATHGRPNDLNAHPHVDCTGEITVIHNGIIENFRRAPRRPRGARPRPRLRDGHGGARPPRRGGLRGRPRRRRSGPPWPGPSGAYAIAVMHRREPDRLVGARMNVPLVVGLGDGETFLASDVAAILAHTNRVVFLEEGDVADLRPGASRSRTSTGRRCERAVTEIDWTAEAAEKGGFEHFMLKEIHEQPQALRQCIAGRVAPTGRRIRVDELAPLADVLRTIDAGRARRLRDRLLRRARRGVGAPGVDRACRRGRRSARSSATAPPPLDGRTLVIAVTQSGETADTIAPTRYARERGCPIVAVTNTRRLGDHPRGGRRPLPPGRPGDRGRGLEDVHDPGDDARHARGRDRPGPRRACRRQPSDALVAALLRPSRGGRSGRSTQRRRDARPCPALRQLPGLHVRRPRLHVPGRPGGRPQAQGGQLRPRRGVCRPGELKHGPISLLDAECPLVAVATRSAVYDKLISNVMEGRARDARVIAVATEGDPRSSGSPTTSCGSRTRSRP